MTGNELKVIAHGIHLSSNSPCKLAIGLQCLNQPSQVNKNLKVEQASGLEKP